MLLAVIVVRVISLSSHIKSQSLACMNHVIDNAPINYESTEKKTRLVCSKKRNTNAEAILAFSRSLYIMDTKKKELTSAVR